MLDLYFTVDGLHVQLSNSPASTSPAAVDSVHSERVRRLGFPRFVIGHIGRINSDFKTLETQAQNSRSPLRCGASPRLERFCAFVEKDDIPEDVLKPLLVSCLKFPLSFIYETISESVSTVL